MSPDNQSVDYQTHPGQYKHWSMKFEGPVRARDGLTHVALLAISSRPGDAGQLTLEIPPIERRRAGLRAFKDAWVALDEFNYDIVEKSHYLDPSQAALGRFSKSFMMQVAKRLAPAFASKGARIDRL